MAVHLNIKERQRGGVRDKALPEFIRGIAQLWLRESRKVAWRRKHWSRMRIIFINCKGTGILEKTDL